MFLMLLKIVVEDKMLLITTFNFITYMKSQWVVMSAVQISVRDSDLATKWHGVFRLTVLIISWKLLIKSKVLNSILHTKQDCMKRIKKLIVLQENILDFGRGLILWVSSDIFLTRLLKCSPLLFIWKDIIFCELKYWPVRSKRHLHCHSNWMLFVF